MTETTQPNLRELRNFALLLGAIFAALFGLAPMLLRHPIRIWPWVVALTLWCFALLAPAALRPFYRGWTRLGHALGWINTRIILTLLYAVVVTPLGLAMRLLGRDPMARKFDAERASYRVPVKERSHKQMERPY